MELRQAVMALGTASVIALVVPAAPASAKDLAFGWSVGPVEAPLGDTRSCAVTKMTGTNRGIGFTRTSSGLELLTVAVEGWSYPLGEQLSESVAIGDSEPIKLAAFGQNDATLAKGSFSQNDALRSASSLKVMIGDKALSFDISGLDNAFDALKACVDDKS